MLANNIKKYRKEKRMSQEQLAEKAGVTYTTLIKLEGGFNDNPTIKTLKNIAGALGISIDNLIK